MNQQPITRYDTFTQVIHWVTAMLVLIAFIYGPGGPEHHIYSAAGDFDRHLHETLGLCVFVLVLIRIGWKFFYSKPEPPAMPRWMTIAAASVQGILMLLLLALPLTAITGAWLEGHPLTLLGGIEIPPLLNRAHDLGKTIASIHGWLGDVIIYLAGAHAAAAIYHHVYRKDNVLISMLPHWFTTRILRRQGVQ